MARVACSIYIYDLNLIRLGNLMICNMNLTGLWKLDVIYDYHSKQVICLFPDSSVFMQTLPSHYLELNQVWLTSHDG